MPIHIPIRRRDIYTPLDNTATRRRERARAGVVAAKAVTAEDIAAQREVDRAVREASARLAQHLGEDEAAAQAARGRR